MQFKFRAGLVITLFLVFSLVPSLLLYCVGYKNNIKWNKNSELTECMIFNYTLNETTCVDYYGGGGGGGVKKRYNNNACYLGYIIVKYAQKYTKDILITNIFDS